MSRSDARSVHLVDCPHGPLVGDGRLIRARPFAITAALSMMVAVPATSWVHPALAVAGSALGALMIPTALFLPWNRVGRTAQLIPPFVFLLAMLLLGSGTGTGIESAYVTMAVLPLMWLAIYENRTAVLSAAAMTAAGLWLATSHGHAQPSDLGGVAIIVFVVVGAGMGVTLHGLVADARSLTRSGNASSIAAACSTAS